MDNPVPANVTVINTGNLSNIRVYNIGDDWEVFSERLDQYLKANRVEDGIKASILITSISEDAYKILKNLCDPDKPYNKTYAELVELLNSQFKPKVSLFRKRAQFDLFRQDSESVNEWYVKVKKLAADCEFGVLLTERVKDKFVVGMKHGPVLDRLCEETPSKNLEDLLNIALSKEAALRYSKGVEIHKVQKIQRPQVNTLGNKKKNGEQEKEVRMQERLCYHCNKSNHNFSKCKFRMYKCGKCYKRGHIIAACKSKIEKNHCAENMLVDEQNAVDEQNLEMFSIDIFSFESDGRYVKPLYVDVLINNRPVRMEVDTGAGLSCLPYELYKNELAEIELEPTDVILKYYDGPLVYPKGKILANVSLNGTVYPFNFIIVEKAKKSLMGRDIWTRFGLTLMGTNIYFQGKKINPQREVPICELDLNNKVSPLLKPLLIKYSNLFKNELGTYNGEKIKLQLKENINPIFKKPHQIPFAFREKVVKELERLEQEGVIEKVSNSLFGTPLVPVMKANGTVRVCANYKITINKHLQDFNHPLPRIEEIFVALCGGQKFTKLDFLNAYNQLVLDDETSELLAWSTPYGIYKVKRLPYGTKPACSIFQNIVEKVLQGCKGTVNYLDDIVVTGKDEREHLENLTEVLDRLNKVGFRLNLRKCDFFKDSIFYLGHKISKEGLEKDPEKIKAILELPSPKNVTEVRAFVGMINYYSKFIKNFAQKLKPLYNLLQKDTSFKWDEICEQAFQEAKQEVASENVLVHFDPHKPLRLACDASQYGIGGVLLHVMPNNTERPICFASRVLSKAEKNYSMISKEALSIYWSVQKFYQYLAGRKFEILSDHKPLQALFGEFKSLPKMSAGRLQRWSLFLSGFDYTFKYIKGSENVKADMLSRLPLPETETADSEEYDYLHFVENLVPIDSNKLRSETRKDVVLGQIFNFIRYGFPDRTDNEILKPFFVRKEELSIENGIIMWGYRVVVPTKLRPQLLTELHATHEGISKMKSNARSYFWWPSLDNDIEKVSANCRVCATSRPEPNRAALIPCEKSSYFFERIHADFLGPIQGKMILIICDTYSKWVEAYIMRSIDSCSTIEKFRDSFARFGLPRVVVTDNGTQWCSGEFSNFLASNGIKHLTSPPYHAATNGFAENSVKSFKNSMYKALKDETNSNVSFETLMNRYLFHYRNSVHITTGVTPCSLIFRHKIKNRFDLLSNRGNTNKNVESYRGKRQETFKEGDRVLCRDYRNPNKKTWVEAIVDEVLGDRIYLCKLINGNLIWKRHLNQILRDNCDVDPETDSKCEEKNKTTHATDSSVINELPTKSDSFSKSNQVVEQTEKSEDERNLMPDAKTPVKSSVSERIGTPPSIMKNVKSPELTIDNKSKNVSPLRLNVTERPKRQIKPPVRLNL